MFGNFMLGETIDTICRNGSLLLFIRHQNLGKEDTAYASRRMMATYTGNVKGVNAGTIHHA